MSTSNLFGEPPATASPRAQTLAMQGFANGVVRVLLRIPLVNLVVGRRLLVLHVVGRKSGRQYTVPVAYVKHGDALLIGSPFGWIRNLRTGHPVEIRLKGRRRTADVEVLTAEPDVVEHFGVMARANAQFAKFNQIGRDRDGTPDPADLRLAWAAGARGVRLTVR